MGKTCPKTPEVFQAFPQCGTVFSGMENMTMSRVLIRGSVPTRDSVVPAGTELLTDRGKRQISVYILKPSCDFVNMFVMTEM